MLSWIFFLLALRSIILACQSKKAFISRLSDILLGILSLSLYLLLPKGFHGPTFVVACALIALSLYLRLSKSSQTTTLSLRSIIAWSCLYGVGVFATLTYSFFQMTEDKKVAKVIFTGNTQSEWVSWKNPSSKLEGAWLETYEVIIEDCHGKELARQYIYGDLVGLRAEVMTLQWPFQLLGFSNLCHLDVLYNGYQTHSRHNLFPHVATPLPFTFPLSHGLWSKIYHRRWKIPGIKTATLESAYLPLVTPELKPTQGSYWLVIGSSGMTSQLETEIP